MLYALVACQNLEKRSFKIHENNRILCCVVVKFSNTTGKILFWRSTINYDEERGEEFTLVTCIVNLVNQFQSDFSKQQVTCKGTACLRFSA